MRKYICILIYLVLVLNLSTQAQTASFTAPDTVCVNSPVEIINQSNGGTKFYWNFDVADINSTPQADNLGNIGGVLNTPVFSDFVFSNGKYYVFVTNNYPGGLVRMDFGTSLLNTPTVTNLGDVGGIIPLNTEGIQIVNINGNWLILIVGGDPVGSGVPSRVIKLDFGNDLSNAPTGTNWGNVGNLNYPIDLHVFHEGSNWYGFTINANNNTITRFNFGTDFSNTPTATNLGNLGNMSYPTGIFALNDMGYWRVFVTNGVDNGTLTRLDFGNSLLNTPTAVNLGNLDGTLHRPRDLYILRFCDEIVGFVVNGASGFNSLVKLNFNGTPSSVPDAIDLGNIGNFNFPHSISKIFRVGANLFSFVTNVNNNSITRLKFGGASNGLIPPSTLKDPPTISYSSPGVYNISLLMDEGLPTQSAYCKPIVVIDHFQKTPTYDTFFCAGSGVNLSVNSTWPNATWSTGSNDNGVLAQSTGLYWVESQFYGCYQRDSINVVQKALPNAPVLNPVEICEGNSYSVSVQSQPNTIYNWTPQQDVSNPNISNPIITPNGNSNYTLTVTDEWGCKNSSSLPISVNPLPSIQITPDTGLCPGAPLTLSASGGVSFQWLPAGNLSNGNIPNPQLITTVPATYTVLVTDGNGCANRDSVEISVFQKPSIQKTPDTSICQFSTLQLSISGGASYIWSPSATLDNELTATPTASPTGDIRYFVETTDGNHCKWKDSIEVSILQKPSIQKTQDTSICQYSTVQLFISGGTSYIWSPSSTLEDELSATPMATPNGDIRYFVEIRDVNNCIWEDSVSITIFSKPAIQTTPDTTICQNTSIQLFVSGGTNYSWYPAATLVNEGSATPTATPTANTLYQVDITDNNSCQWKDSVLVTIREEAVFSAIADTAICGPADIQLYANGGDTYLWGPSNQVNPPTQQNPIVSADSTRAYWVIISENTCNKADTLFTTVVVRDSPNVQAFSSNDITCQVISSQLNASGGIAYIWSPSTGLSNPNISAPVASPEMSTQYVVLATDSAGCVSSDTVTVYVNWVDKVAGLMPNAFTPNGDGINDCFGVKFWGNISEFNFRVYNRFGQVVFSTANPNECWDGRFKGKAQNSAAFVYVIQATTPCGLISRKGTVMLIR